MDQKLVLQNTSIVVTRPSQQNHNICNQLKKFGATPIAFPCIEICPNPAADLAKIKQTIQRSHMLIFISNNAVNFAFKLFPTLIKELPQDCIIAAVGSSTARVLQRYGVKKVLTPEHSPDSEQLLKHVDLQQVKQKVILIIKGIGGRELLYETLHNRGADVHNIELYERTLPELVDITPLNNKIDLILFTSNETVKNFLELTSGSLQESLLTCQTIVGHQRIAEKVSSLGFKKLPIIAATPSDADMLAAVLQWRRDNQAHN